MGPGRHQWAQAVASPSSKCAPGCPASAHVCRRAKQLPMGMEGPFCGQLDLAVLCGRHHALVNRRTPPNQFGGPQSHFLS